ncbi:glycosyl transferase family protein [Sphingobium sp. DEHP117]|uniref:glycosyl transferase family protein n=1 Tax=Sphingobium sp. DEHP117 TaxID=2993436 RepID=UPI0027D64B08|nr:glycosyl transferase family protein [Sphingobium sp. DEHP117]MDQ4420688.1 glycosyl transferase family protein [Sphingobium sp. DEHP117]
MPGGILEMLESAAAFVAALQYELLLFALAGLLIGGLEDFIFDIAFLGRALWRRTFIYSRHARMTAASLPASARPGPIAIFVPAWNEADVIGAMLRTCLSRWGEADYAIFVGTYPNDPATVGTVAAVAQEDARVRLVILPHDGRTTKADCLNHIWAAMRADEVARGRSYKAVVLHDAEDVVHADEIRLFDTMIDRFDMVQLPVMPLLSRRSRWIAGHYADEFAEAHGKHLVLREAIGAAVPSAGVGCAFARVVIGAIADERGDRPFDAGSLTEDYEIGLRIAERKGRTAFVTMKDGLGDLICTQEHFPETIEAAVKQKARWLTGISLAGWDRLGWRGHWRERWMRLHDRRTSLSALVLFAAYCATIGYGLSLLLTLAGVAMPPRHEGWLGVALKITAALMLWRLAFRAYWTGRAYGWREGLCAVPRVIVCNVIAMLAARRAMADYVRQLRGGAVIWHKTHHRFPLEGDLDAHGTRA